MNKTNQSKKQPQKQLYHVSWAEHHELIVTADSPQQAREDAQAIYEFFTSLKPKRPSYKGVSFFSVVKKKQVVIR